MPPLVQLDPALRRPRPGSDARAAVLALYVHIPFCVRKCHYCDFASGPAPEHLHEEYTRAVCREIRASPWAGAPVATVFFGGGTPSELALERLERIAAAIRETFDLAACGAHLEWTAECNPGTLDGSTFPALLAMGFNRISLGVQTFDDARLSALNRVHDAAESRQAIRWAREAGVTRLNLDLIFALPGQSQTDWTRDLDEALSFEPEHVSLYGLTIEPNTEFGHRVRRGELQTPDEDVSADMYEYALDACERAGLMQYEVSNFARPGEECRHNVVYWRQEPFVGFGPSAASYWEGERWSNARSLQRYLASVDHPEGPELEHHERLETPRAAGEAVMLGLRTAWGADLRQVGERHGIDLLTLYAGALDSLAGDGLITRDGARIRLTRTGLLLANRVCAEFL